MDEMGQAINYLAFIVVVVVVTIIHFELPGANRVEVEKPGKIHMPQTAPARGYWDYALVAGMGMLLLLEIFLISI